MGALGKLLSLGKQADVDMEHEMTEVVTSNVVRNMEEELKSRQAYFKRNRQAYDSDDDDDDMPRGGQRVQCAQSRSPPNPKISRPPRIPRGPTIRHHPFIHRHETSKILFPCYPRASSPNLFPRIQG